MSALAISIVICALLIAGALVGVLLRRALPEHHLDQHAKDIVRLGCGLLATIVGLVLGLLISSAKTGFDTQLDGIRRMTSNIIMLDSLLDQYGPEARPARVAIRNAMPVLVERLWDDGMSARPDTPFVASSTGLEVYREIGFLKPATEAQRFYQGQAMQLANALVQQRLVLFEQSGGHMPTALLVVLAVWLFILFASFSLFSPVNAMALAAVVVIALSASAAIFLILEMYYPFTGLMQIDREPLLHALRPLA